MENGLQALEAAKRRVAAAYRDHDERRVRWLNGELDTEPQCPDWQEDSIEVLASLDLQLEEYLADVEHPHPNDNPQALQGIRGWRRRLRGKATLLYRRAPRLLAVPDGARCEARQRPRERRSAASSRTSGTDPGDDDPAEPPSPASARPALAPPPRAICTYGCLTVAERGEDPEVAKRGADVERGSAMTRTPTQRERALRALHDRAGRGITQLDFDGPTIDGLPPIRRLASRIDELRAAGSGSATSSGSAISL